ncbi:MAG: rod shape-determining protein MreD [Bacillota bacterium]
MHYFILAVLLFLSLTLETTVFDLFTFYGAKPDFLLILVLFYALFRGSIAGAKIGFIFGLAEDLLLGRFVGLNAATKMLIGYLAGFGERKLFKDNLILPLLVVFIGSILSHLIYIFFFSLVSGLNQFILFRQFALPLAAYNSLMGFIIYKPFSKYMTREFTSHRFK